MIENVAREAELRWEVHLARQSPKRLIVVLPALVGVTLLGYLFFRHWLMAVAGFWMVFSACAEYLLPIRYSMNEQEVRQRGALELKVMRWADVKRVVWSKQGVLLSPFAQPSRLDAFRGIFLWYGAYEAEIRSYLTYHVPSIKTSDHDGALEGTVDGGAEN